MTSCRFCPRQLRSDNRTGVCQQHRFMQRQLARRCRFCGRPLRCTNTTEACRQHQHLLKVRPEPARRCACGRPLRSDNRSGHCKVCHNGPARRRRQTSPVVLGAICPVVGCPHFRVRNSPFCQEHTDAWAESAQRIAAASAVKRFLLAAGQPEKLAPQLTREQLSRMADELLGPDFGRLPATDAMLRIKKSLDDPDSRRDPELRMVV